MIIYYFNKIWNNKFNIIITFCLIYFGYLILNGFYHLYGSTRYMGECSEGNTPNKNIIIFILYIFVSFLQLSIISFIKLRLNIFNYNIYYFSVLLYIILVIISTINKEKISNLATITTIISTIIIGLNYMYYFIAYKKYNINTKNKIVNMQEIVNITNYIKKKKIKLKK